MPEHVPATAGLAAGKKCAEQWNSAADGLSFSLARMPFLAEVHRSEGGSRMSQFIVVPDENGKRVFVNQKHDKKVDEQKSLSQAAIWVEGEPHPLMAHDKDFMNVMSVLEKHSLHT